MHGCWTFCHWGSTLLRIRERQRGGQHCLREQGFWALQAAQLPKGSMERLLLVAAFAQSGFAAGLRPYKCLNPVAGETFEVGCQPICKPYRLCA